MLQFNKDKNRFWEMPAETYFHKNAPTAEIPEDTDLGHRGTAPTKEIPTDLGHQGTAPIEEIPQDEPALGHQDLGHQGTAPAEKIPQDEQALDQMLRGLLTDISPGSGEAMASALGLLVDVDDDSESSSNMD